MGVQVIEETILGNHDISNQIVSVSITTEFPSYVKSVLNQLKEKRFSFVSDIVPLQEESKVFVRTPIKDLHKLATLYRVERIFLNIYSVPISENHPLLTTDTDSYLRFLDEMHDLVDMNAVSDVWSMINGGKRPVKWTAIVRRVGGKTTTLYRNLDKQAFQNHFRDSIDARWSSQEFRGDSRKPILPSRKGDREVAFQIFCRVVPTRITVGIPLLTRRSRKQFVFAHKGLHHSCCWGLARLAALKTGDVCVDAMCGKASILCEAADYFPFVSFIGSDISQKQIEDGRRNVAGYHPERTDLLTADGTHTPLRAGVADVVIADLPFGKQIGDVAENASLYPRFIREMSRVLSSEGRAVVMTSRQCAGIILPTIKGEEDEAMMPAGYGRLGGDDSPSSVFVEAVVPMILGSIDCVVFLLAGEALHGRIQKGEKALGDVFGLDEDGVAPLSLEEWFKGEVSEAEGGKKWSRVNWKEVKPTLVPFTMKDDAE